MSHKTVINRSMVILLIAITLQLVISLLPIHYGYFIDELYAIAMSKNLALGYLPVPPLLPFCLAITRHLFGPSLTSLHILPALSRVIVLIFTYKIVNKLNGGAYAQILALACVLLAPVSVVLGSLTTYDCLNQVFWILAIYSLVLLLLSDNKKYLLYFGIAAGFGLLTKFDFLWLGLGVVIALLLTKNRKYFLTWQLWLSGIIALVIFSPYLIWIVKTHFILLYYFDLYSGTMSHVAALGFIVNQLKITNLIAAPVWILGLGYLLFHKEGKKLRLLGIAYLVILLVCILLADKFYRITPFYPMLFASGAILISKGKVNWLKNIYLILIIVSGVLLIPYGRPILPTTMLPKYMNHLSHYRLTVDYENRKNAVPQWLGDRFDWEELTKKVAKVYHSLPNEQRANTYIFPLTYGTSSAIYFFRKKYDLPIPISTHQQYFLWGYRGANKNSTFITTTMPISMLKKMFKHSVYAGKYHRRFSSPKWIVYIYINHGLRAASMKQFWKRNEEMFQ
ncbi:glycosyltransferase family 39 protein [bacterium]|nr:glycosyltransferase family 39 protein [bacterium]